MLKEKVLYILFLSSMAVYSQQLENTIYNALDTFIKKQDNTSLKILTVQENLFVTSVSNKNEQLALVILQCNKAYYLKQHNQTKEAISTYEKAWKRFSNEKLTNYDIIEYCLKPLGNLYTITQNYTSAENIINQYIFLAKKKHNKQHIIAGVINLSVVYHNVGNYQKAILILEKTLQNEAINEEQKKMLQNNLTTNFVALKKYTKAQVLIHKNVVTKNKSQVNFYKNAAQIASQQGNYQKAIQYFNQAKEIVFQQKHILARTVAKLYTEEAQLLMQMSKDKKAIESLQKAIKTLLPNFDKNVLPSKEMLYAENTFIDIFDTYGDIHSNIDLALKSYDLAFYISFLMLKNITSQETKILHQINNRLRSEKCIELLYYQCNKQQNEQNLKKAFQYAEKNKAYVLKEMYHKKSLLQQFPNDSILNLEEYLVKKQEQLTNKLIQEQLANATPSKINNISKALIEVNFKLITIKNKIESKYTSQNIDTISIKKVQRRLEQDKAVLATYFYGKNALYQFVITSSKLTLKKIKIDEIINEELIDFIHFFDNATTINNDVKKFTEYAFKIYKTLKFDNTLSYKNVIVVPDGLLNFIPFEALLTKRTNTRHFSKMPFVIKEQAIVYNSSALFYLKESKSTQNRKLLGVFPVFKNTHQELRYSLKEANAIKNEITSTLFLNEKATKENFVKNASKYAILHLSTHASSETFIKPASIQFYDQTMSLNELYSLNLDSELVVLSACETGVGRLQKGEGAMSIARGFQYAGAQNILFSLWQINDRTTAQMMQLFYENYQKDQSAYLANCHSKRSYLKDKSISNSKKSPYYWSAFVYYGKLTPSINKSKWILYSICILLVIILILMLVKYIKKLVTLHQN